MEDMDIMNEKKIERKMLNNEELENVSGGGNNNTVHFQNFHVGDIVKEKNSNLGKGQILSVLRNYKGDGEYWYKVNFYEYDYLTESADSWLVKSSR